MLLIPKTMQTAVYHPRSAEVQATAPKSKFLCAAFGL